MGTSAAKTHIPDPQAVRQSPQQHPLGHGYPVLDELVDVRWAHPTADSLLRNPENSRGRRDRQVPPAGDHDYRPFKLIPIPHRHDDTVSQPMKPAQRRSVQPTRVSSLEHGDRETRSAKPLFLHRSALTRDGTPRKPPSKHFVGL